MYTLGPEKHAPFVEHKKTDATATGVEGVAGVFGLKGKPAQTFVEMCHRCFVQRLEIFGSAATHVGYDPARSDIDILVTFLPLPPTAYANAFFSLQTGLEALSGRKVDLLTEAALKNPYLRERIAAERVLLFSL